ncbi:LacI family transcriptional regulator, partial [bacterium]|nr:LacI family transcriptional regulator [bacterium]
MSTIRDVARIAGVSIATVSRVFNGNAAVNEDKAQRVWTAASELDYWPNGAARSLTTSRSNTLGVLLPDLYGEFFSEVIRGIDQLARHEKYQTLISSSHANVEDVLTATRAMRGRIDGLIMMAPDNLTVEIIAKIRDHLPVILVNPPFAVDGCSSVSIASFSGARAAVAHLVGLGHREIAMVAGPAGNVDADERLRGYRRGLAEAGIEPRDELVVQGDFRESSGYLAA